MERVGLPRAWQVAGHKKFGTTRTNTGIITNSHQNTKMNEHLIKEWSSVPPVEFLWLGESLSRNAEAILAAHGGPTPYKDTLTWDFF